MDLCSKKHPEVCFEERFCPVCELMSSMEERIESLERRLQELGN